jgi:hypothetical protein
MKTMLILMTSQALEEDMVDFLLDHPHVEGFTSLAAYGHGHTATMSVTEQVAGRRKRVQFQIIMDVGTADSLTQELTRRVGQDVLFWQVPVSGLGRT